jgi:RNA polymerase sigma factor (sigma-70 family)
MAFAEYRNLQDDELIERIRNGESARAYEVLYHRYYAKVFDKCYSFVKKREIAEELSRDILSKAYEKLFGFKHHSSFSSWLYSITYNHCIDYLREKKKLHYPEWNKENELPEIIDEEENLNEISFEKLILALEKIHPEEKAIILMKYQDNLSLKQIASALRISEDAVKMRLKRARTRLIYTYSQYFMQD